MKIDHFAVSGMKLEEATEYVESTLGYKMEKGGKHKLFGTHNNLLGLKDGLYIEAIAVDPAVKNLNFSRWFNLKSYALCASSYCPKRAITCKKLS